MRSLDHTHFPRLLNFLSTPDNSCCLRLLFLAPSVEKDRFSGWVTVFFPQFRHACIAHSSTNKFPLLRSKLSYLRFLT